MHTIELENMEFFAHHGCFEEEQITGNKFIVNLKITAKESLSEITDNINDAVNYQTIYNIVGREMKQRSHLLENVCKRILDAVYQEIDNIETISVKISKVNPPMGGKIYCASVTMQLPSQRISSCSG
ncbi:MAG: dihydroneopterin aldolase [Prevotellaceae bacterium]|jgi:dihydroneopterin aldolase|nr:dihydroneopterin aldolase [Prevotellaceae bacterium]